MRETPRLTGCSLMWESVGGRESAHITKEFALSARHEDLKLELRLEAENACNHPVFGTPDTIVGDPNFGVINDISVQPRRCQLALKLYF